MSKPKKTNLTLDELEPLKSRVKQSNLSDNDMDLVLGLFDFNGWLQQKLLESRISISCLRTMVFGEPTTSVRGKTHPPKKSTNPRKALTP